MAAIPKIDALEAQVGDGLADLIAAGRAALANLERQRAELDREIAAYSRKLRTWENVARSLGSRPQAHLHLVEHQLPTKREAVLAFLAEHAEDEFKLIEIRRALIERGWMTNSQAHALEVAVRDMERRGEIQRVRKGVYTLRPARQDEWTAESIGVQT